MVQLGESNAHGPKEPQGHQPSHGPRATGVSGLVFSTFAQSASVFVYSVFCVTLKDNSTGTPEFRRCKPWFLKLAAFKSARESCLKRLQLPECPQRSHLDGIGIA